MENDWIQLAQELGISETDIELVKEQYPNNVSQQAMVMLRLWLRQSANNCSGIFYMLNITF